MLKNMELLDSLIKKTNSFLSGQTVLLGLSFYFYSLLIEGLRITLSEDLGVGGNSAAASLLILELFGLISVIFLLKITFSPNIINEKGFFTLLKECIWKLPITTFYTLMLVMIFVLGLILLILPGIYFGSLNFFAPYLSVIGVNENSGYFDLSRRMTRDYFWQVLLIIIIFYCLPFTVFSFAFPFLISDFLGYEKISVSFALLPLSVPIAIYGQIMVMMLFKELYQKTFHNERP